METRKQNVIIFDTQILITESLKKLLADSTDYFVLDVIDSLQKIKSILSSQKVHLLIIDSALIEYKGQNILIQIKKDNPDLKVLILTNSISHNEFKELSRLGIKNIIYKTTSLEELFLCIDATIKNKKYYCSEVLDILMDNHDTNNDNYNLTPSETEIVKLISDGLTTKEIADKKHISFHTVVTHRKNIFRKLGINNASELVMFAVRTGIINDNIDYYI